MDKINVKLENCYGIKSLETDFDFTKSNVYSIYAPNGTMKTSFLKTFKSLEEGENPKDEIYNDIEGTLKRVTDYNIIADGDIIDSNQIFTISSINEKYQAKNLKDLLLNEELSVKLDHVFEKKDNFISYLNNKTGKIGLDNIENILKNICGKTDSSFLEVLEDINDKLNNYNDEYKDITYNDIYGLEEKIEKDDFQNNIDNFILKNEEIYETIGNKLLSKENNFGLFRLKNIQSNLKKENFFFDEGNLIIIKGVELNKDKLNDDIKKIDSLIKDTDEFKKINKILSTVGGNKLKELIENTLIPIEELKNENRYEFYNKIIMSYIISEIGIFKDLLESFKEVKDEIKSAGESDEGTLWRKVVDEFNQRFHVPFKISVSNIKSVILGESTEKIIFYFCDKLNKDECNDDDWIPVNSEENLELVLSQGEKRALYLLKILFEIENKTRLINSGELGTQLLIIDDIADSFDYKNKYAIIHYLSDISERTSKITGEKCFNIIILSHNFDFYRTVQSRLGIYGEKNLYTLKRENGIELINGSDYLYSINDIIEGGQGCIYKYLALIPIARNLVEYIIKKESDEYGFLTSMLHSNGEKNNKGILNSIYNTFLMYELDEDESGDIHELVKIKCSEIGDEDLTLDKKVVLSIGIRYEAEIYMNKKLEIEEGITKQIGKLYNQFKKSFTTDSNLALLSDVVLMTPENIHLNSFMYEPILDMSDWHLKELYKKVKTLNDEVT